ncbi:MAG: PilZ domain-containing protein [Desulfobulbaceae bacterium]|nr:PilZ domain-containing protein [Desulfobulbaceae bacterium]
MEFLFDRNRRICSRYETIGIMSKISDGESTFVGVVADISINGLRISHIPAPFNDMVEKCYSIVNGPANDFVLALHPRWMQITNNGMYKMIGFKIEDPPANWTAFVVSIKENGEFSGFVSQSAAA